MEKQLKLKLIPRSLKDIKEALAIATCIRNSEFGAKSIVCVFNESQCQTEKCSAFNPLLLIHAKR